TIMRQQAAGRRQRRGHPWSSEVLNAIWEGIYADSSADAIVRELESKGFHDLPDVRTIQRWKREERRDGSGEWTLLDASPADVRVILETLQVVNEKSGERIKLFTQDEAKLIAVYRAAGDPPWTAYVAARGYL